MAMTASICAALACNSTAIVGIATLTMKASTPNMNCAATTIASTHQRREESTGVETIWCILGSPVRNLLHAQATDFGHPGDYLRGKRSRGFGPIAAWESELPAVCSAICAFGTAFDVRL